MPKSIKKAFSLVELSIVLLIIGIIIAGVTQASVLIQKHKLSSARNITKSSPVPSIKGIMLWLESTSEESFDDLETEDGSSVTRWHDINPLNAIKYDAVSSNSNRPIYKTSCISGLPCVRFNSVTDGGVDYLDSSFGSLVGLTSFTIFFVFNHDSVSDNEFPLYSIKNSAMADGLILLFIRPDGAWQTTIRYSNSGSFAQNATTTSGISKPYLITFGENSGVGLPLRVNEYQFAFNTAEAVAGGIKNVSGFRLGAMTDGDDYVPFLGSPFHGDIAELIVFDRYLKNEEIRDIEEYLAKKWNIKKFE